ncbi:S-layer homology domain-containing protein [Indiicoccus explosivorum]|uniref:S-layer homology domain-containing protein n=1 Tax=Indiicoccus explosivorum TaxID=1917864 RepID=UPI000B4512AB|nr:S-layer homology domain-containing protein [Indiicoccus explosivorum]
MKKLIAVLVVTLSLGGVFTSPAIAAGFPDVDPSDRFYDEIMYLTGETIINGFPDGTFQPKGDVTRAQAAIMIGRALGFSGTQQDTKFPDVDADVKASGYIDALADVGIINGYPDGTFRPGDVVTRAEMAIFLHRAFVDGSAVDGTENFSDVASGMRSYEAIADLRTLGVAGGYPDGTFRPDVELTREQFAAFMARAVNPEVFALPVTEGEVEVTFLEVGQGDAILIEYPNGEVALVDAGRYGTVIDAALQAVGVTQIDTFIATHPDADHIGGAAYVINNYGVTHVVDSGQVHTTEVFADYLAAVEASGATFQVAEVGDDVSDDASVEAEVLAVNDAASDFNEGSIVIMLTHGLNDFLLTGDAEASTEAELVANYNLDAEVLKVGHHGSDSSTTQAFVDEVDPLLAVISVGENSYGHPTQTVVNRLLNSGAEVISTMDGTVIVESDGTSLYVTQLESPTDGGVTPPPPKPPVDETTYAPQIVGKNLESETVTIQNTGSVDVDMTGWMLVSVEGNQVYTFPAGYILRAGYSVNINSGRSSIHNPPSDLEWSDAYIWNNTGDEAELYDSSGVLISERP